MATLEQRPMFRTCSPQEKRSEDNALRVAERLRMNVRCFRTSTIVSVEAIGCRSPTKSGLGLTPNPNLDPRYAI